MPGTVRNGVVIPDSAQGLSEGDRVQIVVLPEEPYLGFWEEHDDWERVSDQALALTDEPGAEPST